MLTYKLSIWNNYRRQWWRPFLRRLAMPERTNQAESGRAKSADKNQRLIRDREPADLEDEDQDKKQKGRREASLEGDEGGKGRDPGQRPKEHNR
jgi:hypothetical protein